MYEAKKRKKSFAETQ
ncbi:hypothetical protein LACR_1385 [Lactococcus cremoris subsp. cremoris SK11]|uniref:Uncharacterized protein n=1 Tax=Lactococcus lactis subsp. cremoris (strain SK11) TaxID=272622 RepID=Q02YR9_LACLS|nr:hypothetical protein LACR_1385 [Lactococcus cremoris subsp. cremoris SK11]